MVLLPRGKHTLPKLEQLQVNVSVLTDPMGRPINNGKNFNATVTNTGLVISRRGARQAAAPTAAAVDALFEQGWVRPLTAPANGSGRRQRVFAIRARLWRGLPTSPPEPTGGLHAAAPSPPSLDREDGGVGRPAELECFELPVT